VLLAEDLALVQIAAPVVVAVLVVAVALLIRVEPERSDRVRMVAPPMLTGETQVVLVAEDSYQLVAWVDSNPVVVVVVVLLPD
jgi:hypothetical protein